MEMLAKIDSAQSASASEGQGKAAPIIGVLGVKGGVGATTLAVNLTALFARRSTSTLIDANLQQPDCALYLALQPQYTLADLLERSEDLDRQIYAACCSDFSGARQAKLISPPLDGISGAGLNLSFLAASLIKLRHFSGSLVVDLPKQIDRNLVQIMDCCDRLVLVFEPTIVSLAALKRWILVLKDLDYPLNNVAFVLNRAGAKPKYVEAQVLDAMASLGVEPVLVPNAYAAAQELAISGETLVKKLPRDPFAKGLEELVKVLNV